MFYLKIFDWSTLVSAMLTIFFGMSAAMSLIPKNLRQKMLSFNQDGVVTMIFGVAAMTFGLFVRDYTAAYLLYLVGEAVVCFGAWTAINDRITDGLLNEKAFPFYLLAFAAAVYYGAAGHNASIELAAYYLARLTLPVAVASLLAVLTLLSFSSTRFKLDVLSLNTDGVYVMGMGAVFTIMSMVVGANPVMVIALGALGSVLIALGGLIVLYDWITDLLLKPWMATVYVAVMVALLYYSRGAF